MQRASALALSRAGADPFDGSHPGVGQQALQAVLDSQSHENSNEGVERDPLAFLEASDGAGRDARLLSKLLLGRVAGEPDALDSPAEGSFNLVAFEKIAQPARQTEIPFIIAAVQGGRNNVLDFEFAENVSLSGQAI